tara:strand:+ start:1716 stop:4034 length:2319 start_codon:yes stop_codon:yes gene_type:complete
MNKNICKSAILRGGSVTPLIIPNEITDGLGLMNPSIIKVKDKILMVIRWVGYSLYHSEYNQLHQSPYGPLVYLNPEDDVTLTTRNFICELDKKTLELKKYNLVDTSKLDVKPLWEFVGLEDARLVNWDNKILLTGVRRDTTTNGQGRMEISEVKNYKEISRNRIEAPKDTYCEKNWMPILDKPNHYVKWCNPTEVVKVNNKKDKAKTVKIVKQDLKLKRDLRGGSQVIKYKDYWVCITHEVDLWKNEQNNKDCEYYHRFIVWDKDWKIVHHSDEFKFMDAQIEFTCGMLLEGDNFYIPFGYQDTTAFMLKLPCNMFDEMVGIKKKQADIGKLNTEGYINKFINDPNLYKSNYDLGIYYFGMGQYSSALSFFLRTAETETPEDLVYESLLFVALCIHTLGRRGDTELALWHNAIRYKPNRPEAYLFVSQYFEVRNKFSEAESYAKIGLEFKDNSKPMSSFIKYQHFYEFHFQIALCKWNLGDGNKSRKLFTELAKSNYPLTNFYKELIKTNLNGIGEQTHPCLPYDKSMSKLLKHKFYNYDKIEKNYSQTYQDMFVLSMLDGKTNGEYLEIGSADPFEGSNTALLEELGWTGISLEIDKEQVNNFKKHRKNPVVLCDANNYDYSNLIGVIDYLQVDCEPPSVTFDILTNLPFDKCDFKVITYEHDHYTDVNSKFRELSRLYLQSKGYKIVVGNIAPNDEDCFEDWYVHPKYIKPSILENMIETSDNTIKASKYMLNNENDTTKKLESIDLGSSRPTFLTDEEYTEMMKKKKSK